jgi:NAD(P)-dependent dehydrogenase (short-subunit alcohol dehydrogenase family)
MQNVLRGKENCGKGKVALVTGANTGIGKTAAKGLASVGFNVVIAGRTISALEAAKTSIDTDLGLKSDGDGGRITILKTPLELSSVASIKAYAQDFLEQKMMLHVLVNNAGVSNFPGKTKEGLEYTMGVNWFGGFLLTNLLLDVLKQSQPSRVVILSSGLHTMGRVTVDNIDKLLEAPAGNNMNQAYNDSKLANILHAVALAKRLAGTGIACYSLHPGVVKTDFGRNLSGCFGCCLKMCQCCLRNASDGAATTVYCATADLDANANGKYFADARMVNPNNAALKDDKVSEALWAKGEELTKKFA